MNEANKNIKKFGLGLIGCGGFGRFCMAAYANLPGIRPVAVADMAPQAANDMGKDFRLPAHHDPMELIARGDVDIVHIATPPSSHYELVLAAAKAGKNVLCEKPLATDLGQADEMLAAVRKAGVICPVNFVLRYNRVTEAVKAVIDSGALGKVLSARLTNCASDSGLGPNHWFWDKAVSGGIFIEHGVHFFDLYNCWLGEGRVINATAMLRENATVSQALRQNSGQEDRVMCTVLHNSGAVASHYHGFDQTGPLDRTDHRLVCELGDIFVEGWIPLTLKIYAAVNDDGAAKLAECCPGCKMETVENLEMLAGSRQLRGRGVERNITRVIRLTCTPNADKQAVYAESVGKLMADQIAYLMDKNHQRIVTEQNGRDAVALAQSAAISAASGKQP